MFFSKVDNNSLIFNWNCLFLKFACKDQFPPSFYLKLFPNFVGIIFLRHEPRAVAPLQSIRWAKAICLSCNVKCMLFLSFLHVPMSVPPLEILYALPCRFSSASCPFPLHFQRTKMQKGGEVGGRVWVEWGGEGWSGWRGWVKVGRGWGEGGMKDGVWRRLPKIDTK